MNMLNCLSVTEWTAARFKHFCDIRAFRWSRCVYQSYDTQAFKATNTLYIFIGFLWYLLTEANSPAYSIGHRLPYTSKLCFLRVTRSSWFPIASASSCCKVRSLFFFLTVGSRWPCSAGYWFPEGVPNPAPLNQLDHCMMPVPLPTGLRFLEMMRLRQGLINVMIFCWMVFVVRHVSHPLDMTWHWSWKSGLESDPFGCPDFL